MNFRSILSRHMQVVLLVSVSLGGGRLALHGAVKGAPAITANPSSVAACPGESVSLSVTATGYTPLKYQWRKNGSALAGATKSVYSIASVAAGDAGSYTVLVSNYVGTALSAVAALTVNTPVTISPLMSLERAVGANAVFSTTASGTGPFNYVWEKDGVALSGQTTDTLLLTSLALTNSGIYRVTVNGACGSATSSATLVVDECYPAVDVMLVIDRSGSMLGQKYKDARLACSNFVRYLNFSMAADQAGLASYNTSATLDRTLTNNVSALDQAIGDLPGASGNTSISSGLLMGQAELASARHNSNALPAMVLLSDGLPTGSDTKSKALANAMLAKNAGTRVFTIGLGSDVDPVLMQGIASSPGDYFFASDSSELDALFANISTLLCRPPTNVFINGLSNQTVCAGSAAVFMPTITATFSNCAPYGYQWQKNGMRLAGQTESALVIPNASTADAGTYSLEVTSVCRCVTNSATLTVNSPVGIVGAVQSLTNCPGTPATFSVSAVGTGLAYQWYKDGSLLTGKTAASLTLDAVSSADAGTYSVVVNGLCGLAVTNSGHLVVSANTTVMAGPVDLTTCAGTTANFSVNATGTGLSYQWYKGASALVGKTSSTLALANVSAADAGTYSVVVSGACGIAVTNSASLTVNENVAVVSGPVSLTNCPGTSASFSVSAIGTGLNYQWYKGGSALAGQTGSSLVLANIGAADAGDYSVVVSGTCGDAVTNSASLTVNENVVVLSGPVSLTNCPGTRARFVVLATGTGLSYQWYKNGEVLQGQTGVNLVLREVTAADVGTYSVLVSGTCGSPVTNSASLMVNEDVAVVSGPVNLTNCPGTSASFSVNATGTGLSYQWYKGASALVGKTSSTLALANVSAADAGTYSVVVSGACGIAVTNSASLTVNENVAVVSGPVSLTNCPGTSASFSVNATGTGLSYQWYKGASALAGQTGSTLTLAGVNAADAGIYTVVVSGTCGTAVTNSASLTVNESVVVVSGPVSLTNCPGTSASFSVNASGTGLSYQWYKGASALVGQTGSILTLASVSAADAGTYTVVVSGTCGNAATNSASLTVNESLAVVSGPVSLTNCPSTSASFSVNATGTGLSYQWYKGSSTLVGKTGSTLTLASVSAVDAGTYTVVVSGTCGNAVTNSASLTVNESVTVVSGPVSLTNCPGTSASFSVNATGTGLRYQWYKGASALVGKTGSTLTVASVSAADAGTYTVVVSGTCGNAVTNSASLTVNASVAVVSGPVSLTNCPGASASFSVGATGTGVSYQWYKDASALAGQTGSTLTLASVSAADTGTYTVVVSGTCGNAVTNSASLTVNESVAVVSGPVSLTNCPGTSASFSVSASGTGLSYQWYKGASALVGQTGSILTLASVSAADAGTYTVVVSGTCGNAVTNSASLTVNASVAVVSGPVSLTNCPGTSASFSVNASGTGLSYQWYRGASALVGKTGSTLALANVSAADEGIYNVVVSGTCGNAVTNSASLTVNETVMVVSGPVSMTNCPGTSASFNVSATGTGLNYQWFKGASALVGKTGSTLALANVSAADAGTYNVVVSGACGNAVTNSASLTVNESVAVVSGPVSLTNCPGTSASFSVNATGTGLSYQWYKGSSTLVGKTGSILTLASVSAANAGTYAVVVSGTCGNAVTNSASLTVNASVAVVSGPVSLTNCPGTSASFSVNATGTGLSYQWYKGASALVGQTGSTLTLASVSAVDAGTYAVVVSGTCGNAVTSSASLRVNESVAVVSSPVSLTNCPGTSASFSVSATGTGLNYQWYKGASALAGKTSSTLSLANVSAADAGTYAVVVSGTCGNAITSSATLTLNQKALVISGPVSVTNCPGSTASFTVIATGTGLNYQWYKGGNALVGQTGNNLTLSNVSAADAGIYRVVVSGVCGNVVTNDATLAVYESVQVGSGPASLTNCPGTPAYFSVSASGSGLHYQWRKDGTPLNGATGSAYVIASVKAIDAGRYDVMIAGNCGSLTSGVATLVVNASTAATPLASAKRDVGGSVTFSTTASGAGPMAYAWKKNGATIASATTASLTLTNLTYADAATYSVTVHGACTTVEQSATLTINHPPTVEIVSPTNGAVFIAPANFTVLADAQDVDGVVTNVQFFQTATNYLGEKATAPHFIVLTNVPVGTYVFTATATDDLGASGDSTPVTVSVIERPPLSVVSAMAYNPQTDLFEQRVRVFNPTYSSYDAVRLSVYGLVNNTIVYNASGSTNGIPFVESHAAIAPGSSVDFVIEYWTPLRIMPNPTLRAQLVTANPARLWGGTGGGGTVFGTGRPINRGVLLPDRSYLLEFASANKRVYYVQYSSDLHAWKTAGPGITGNGTWVQWIDNGEPKTESSPAAAGSRFYRLIELP